MIDRVLLLNAMPLIDLGATTPAPLAAGLRAATMAYVVPAPEFFAQFLALAFMALTALSSVLLWPVYRLLHYVRQRRGPTQPEQPNP